MLTWTKYFSYLQRVPQKPRLLDWKERYYPGPFSTMKIKRKFYFGLETVQIWSFYKLAEPSALVIHCVTRGLISCDLPKACI